MDVIDDLDEIFGANNDLITTEEDLSSDNSSSYSAGEYLTEQAHHNDLMN